MIYLIAGLIISQIIHFIYYQKSIVSVKRRYQIIDSRIHNLSHWMVSNQQSASQQLEKIYELVHYVYAGSRTADVNTVNRQCAEVNDALSFSVLIQQKQKDAVENIKQEDIQHYYALLLQELQQLDNRISHLRKLSDIESPFHHHINNPHFKKEMINRLNGLT